MRLFKLWQWHSVRAVGEVNIIHAARISQLRHYAAILAEIADGIQPINTIQQAADYYSNMEIGYVGEVEIMWVNDEAIEIREDIPE